MSINKYKIGTWNIYCGSPWGFHLNQDNERLTKIIDHILNSDLDILSLQEVGNKVLINNLKSRLECKYNFYYSEKNLVIQYSILFIILFFLYYFIKDVFGLCLMFLLVNFVLKNTTAYNFLLNEINGGLITLIKKKLINKDDIEYTYYDFKEQNGDFLNLINKRGYQKLIINLNNSKLILINTHLNQPIKKCKYRIKQINELYNISSNYKNCILLGDFNSTKDYKELIKIEENFVDSLNDNEFTWDINNILTQNFYYRQNSNKKIDYIFLKNIEFNYSKILFKEPLASDHYGILVEINLPINKINIKDKKENNKKK